MQHYKLKLAYDGTNYLGWQKTKMGRSIQESLQTAVLQIAREEILPQAASRTDRGVHAEGQTVSIYLNKDWDPACLQKALNAALPLDIRVNVLERAGGDFHPALHAVEKEYRYSLCLGAVQDPVHRLYSWAFRHPLRKDLMKKAAEDLLGTRDFSAFANVSPLQNSLPCTNSMVLEPPYSTKMNPALKDGDCRFGPSFELGPNIGFELPGPKGPGFEDLMKNLRGAASAEPDLTGYKQFAARLKEDPICTLRRIEISSLSEERLLISITGNRFLYKMARNIAGTLIYIGCGKLAEGCIPEILSSKDRKKAGVTAPALGLTLYRVVYNG